MKKRTCAWFLFDGYADWEPSLAIILLSQYGDFEVETFSVTGNPIVSMAGLHIAPQKAWDEINPDEIDLLLLPGGEAWEQGGNREIVPLIQTCLSRQKKVAAICGATTLLGELGLLDRIPHTSNDLEYLKQASPAYRGQALYQSAPCVASEQIITANGAGMIEFARAIAQAFGIMDGPTLDAWQELFKSGGQVNRLYA